MPTQKLTPRIEWWKTTKGKINYAHIGKNGETLSVVNQGFERFSGMVKNILAHDQIYNPTLTAIILYERQGKLKIPIAFTSDLSYIPIIKRKSK